MNCIVLFIISFILFYMAFNIKKSNRYFDNEEIWKKKYISSEKLLWISSIVSFVIASIMLCLTFSGNSKSLVLLYLGFLFIFIHMFGEWFLIRCDFEVTRKENTFSQYFTDNILGNLIIKKNRYYLACDPINKVRKSSIIVNRNISILFIFLFILSLHIEIPWIGKTTIGTTVSY